MVERILNYGAVYLGSMFKFIFGPLAGAKNLTVWETALFTFLGMMTMVFLLSLMKDEFRRKLIWRFKRDKRLFTRKNRQMVHMWSKYGLGGVAFFTPLFLMPIGGSIIALSFGSKRSQILKYMAVSAFFWSIVTSFAVHQFYDVVTHFIGAN